VSEFGVFNDEGLIDPGFRTLAEAEAAARQWRGDGEEWAKAAEVCPDHEEQRRDTCEECWGE
jgi:hypothetical protein